MGAIEVAKLVINRAGVARRFVKFGESEGDSMSLTEFSDRDLISGYGLSIFMELPKEGEADTELFGKSRA